jgi:hypothetical protein
MSDEHVERRLAAIPAVNVIGYTPVVDGEIARR